MTTDHRDADVWHVLIVDDDAGVRQVTTLVLKNVKVLGRRLQFHEASSRAEAQAFLESPHPPIALMIVDLMMETDTAGLELVEWVRAQERLRPSRVVVRTGESGTTSPSAVLQGYDISDYWPKTSVLASRMKSQIAGLIRGYTQRRQLEEERATEATAARAATESLAALTEQHRTVRALTDVIDTGVLLLRDRQVLLSNATALSMLGLTERPDFESLPEPILVGEVDTTSEFKLTPLRGPHRWIRCHFRAFEFEGAPCLLATLLDQTDRKLSETQRINAETELLRTQHAEHIGLLAGGVAHDLNNLLAVITSNGSLLREESTGSTTDDALDDILGAARAAASLVQQLLAYSGSGSVFRRRIDVVSTIFESARLWRSQATEAGVDLQLRDSFHPTHAVSDAALIGQVIGNLLSNAIRHTPEGGRVTVTTALRDFEDFDTSTWLCSSDTRSGRHVVFTVEDTGEGITGGIQKIYEPFYSTSSSGRGLGLAAVKGIVQRLGGAIRCTTEVGMGTRFEVALPADDAEEDASVAIPGSGDSLQGIHTIQPVSGNENSKRGLLILDDHPIVRKQLGRIARRAGLDPVLCATISDALDAARSQRFRVAIIDYKLDGETGDIALLKLRQLQPDLPAILCSGYAGRQDFNKFPVKFDAVVPKPFRPKHLTDKIAELMKHNS